MPDLQGVTLTGWRCDCTVGGARILYSATLAFCDPRLALFVYSGRSDAGCNPSPLQPVCAPRCDATRALIGRTALDAIQSVDCCGLRSKLLGAFERVVLRGANEPAGGGVRRTSEREVLYAPLSSFRDARRVRLSITLILAALVERLMHAHYYITPAGRTLEIRSGAHQRILTSK